MPPDAPERIRALQRAALAALLEVAKDLVPGFGPIQAAWKAYHDALRPESLPGQVQDALRGMYQDYQELLEPELREQAGETAARALQETVHVLEKHGLSLEELVSEAGLDPERAARRVLDRAADGLKSLDQPVRALVERMVGDYYRVLLGHRDALDSVGVEALRELLRRTEGLEERFLAALDLRDWRRAWEALQPVTRSLPGPLRPENLLEALRAPYRLVEFTGKAHRALCEEVARSLEGLAPDGSRAWVLWGPGGAGKTRTAVEVALALRAAGWQAFFVPPPFLPAGWAPYLPVWSRPDRPTLLIVDYAEQRPADDLGALAQAVREAAPQRRFPLALLFLMRANPQDPTAGHVAAALTGAWVRYEARMVPPVEDPADRQDLFRRARARFRAELAPPEGPPEVDYDPEALPRTPLALLALAVLAAHGHRVARSQDEVEILTALWEHWEGPRWRRTLQAQGGEELLKTSEVWHEARARVEQALAAASLGRPFTAPEEVAAWWEAHFPLRARTARGEHLDPHWLAGRLRALFPAAGEEWHLPRIEPDPLADVVLARFGRGLGRLADSILPAPGEIAGAYAAVRRLLEERESIETIPLEQVFRVLAALFWPVYMVREVLPRLSDSAAPGAPEAARAALEATARWLKGTSRALPEEAATAWLGAWEGALPPPDRTLLLRPFLADLYRVRLERTPPEATEERARLWNNLGFALSALGRREEALAATEEAVGIYRELAQANPQAFLPDLAMSLNNLGAMLSELGRREEALRATQEAVGIYRELAQENPQAFLPYLATSLNNLGNRLSELGRREEALRATQEAAEIYRRLAQENPQAFLPYLAGSLNNLGRDLSALGRREEALTATQEAVGIYRGLAQANPQAFLPYLATSLNNLGNVLSELGRREEALRATQEAVGIYRELAQANPQAFLPDLATSLNNLGRDLSALGQREEALRATQEAVGIYRELARENPQAFLPYLATSLTNLGNRLSELGRREEALRATQEAVGIYRELAQANPQAFLPDLAMSLNNLGNRLSELGRREEALRATQEAAEIYRRLAQANPQAFLPDLAMSLNNLGGMLSELGRREEALRATQEAAEIYRRLAQANPQAFLPDLAMSLNNLGGMLSELGRREEALRATEEAVEMRRQLARENPQAFLPDLASSLNNLGNRLSELGRREEALTATEEAVGIYRGLAQENPQAFLPYLAGSLNNLGNRLSELGRREEALRATQEAAEIYRRLAQENPQAFLPYLAGSLNNLGNRLSELGRREEALRATEEAVGIYRGLAQENPQAFLPDLAMSLNNLGRDLSALGRREEALTATEEAVGIYRELAQENPQAFLPDLAASLNNLGNVLSALGRREEALTATQEAVEIRRKLAQENPQAFLPDLATSLNNLGNVLSALGRREEALTATEEAVGIYRDLARENSQAFLPDLARSLGAHGSVLRGLGRHVEAAQAFAEGLQAVLPFVRVLPAAFGELTGALLQDYLQACGEAGEAPEAGLVEESVRIIGRPIAIHPAVAGLAPLLLAVAAVAQGAAGPEVAGAVEGALAGMRQREEWRALAEALGRLLTGERDPLALRRGLALDAVDEQALALAERAAAGDKDALALLAALSGG